MNEKPDCTRYDELPFIQTSALRFFIHAAMKRKKSDIQFLQLVFLLDFLHKNNLLELLNVIHISTLSILA